jgi:hypothetical protein
VSGTEWVEPGAEVVLVSPGGWHADRIEGTSVVKTVGKRDVVLENGRRFRLAKGLTEQGRDTHYGSYLLAPDDPKVAEIEEARRGLDRLNAAKRAVKAWQESRTPDNARAAIEALTATLRDEER